MEEVVQSLDADLFLTIASSRRIETTRGKKKMTTTKKKRRMRMRQPSRHRLEEEEEVEFQAHQFHDAAALADTLGVPYSTEGDGHNATIQGAFYQSQSW